MSGFRLHIVKSCLLAQEKEGEILEKDTTNWPKEQADTVSGQVEIRTIYGYIDLTSDHSHPSLMDGR